MRVFVAGGTGFVGRAVLRELKKVGHAPVALVRPGSESKLPFLEGLRAVSGDAGNFPSLLAGMKGCAAAINLIGIIREFPRRGITFEKAHFEAAREIVRAARESGVRRFVHMSSNGAAETGVSAYQTTKWRAEREVMGSGVEWTIFRPSVIFGPGEGLMEFTSTLADVIRKAPVMPVFGGGEFTLDPVAVEDVAACFVKALSNPAAAGRVFTLCGGAPMPYREVIQTIGKALGRPRTRTINVPFALIEPLAAMFGRFAFFPITLDHLRMLRQGNVCASMEWTDVFGVMPKPFSYRNLGYLKERYKG